MTRSVIIIVFSVFILGFSVSVFRNWKLAGEKERLIAVIIIIIWSIMVGLPNIPIFISPFSPPINGTVYDSATKQPIADCYIKANWKIEEIGLAGGHWGTNYQYVTKTNSKGEFHIPRRLKVFNLSGFLPAFEVFSGYNGLTIYAFAKGYVYASQDISRESQFLSYRPVTMTLYPSRPYPEYFTSLNGLKSELATNNVQYGVLTEEDSDFLKEDNEANYAQFSTIYRDAMPEEVVSSLYRFARKFEEFAEFSKAIEVYQRITVEFPNEAEKANRELERLRRNTKAR